MQPAEKKQLKEIKKLIQAKEYQEARAQLATLSHLEVAQNWIQRLDSIMATSQPKRPEPPRVAADATFGNTSTVPDVFAASSAETTFHYTGSTSQSTLNPKYPGRNLGALERYLWFFKWIGHSINWKSYGKPGWTLPSLAFGGLLAIGMVVGFILALLFSVDFPEVTVIGFSMSLSLLLSLPIYSEALAFLQRGAYRTWERNPAALPNHQYNFAVAGLGWLGLTAAIAIGFGVLMYMAWRPASFENAILSLDYPQEWEQIDPQLTDFCVNTDYGCFLYLEEESLNAVDMAFTEVPINGADAETLANQRWFDYQSAFEVSNMSQSRWDVNGHAAIVREFTYSEDGEELYHVMHVHLLGSTNIIEIMAWSFDKASFDVNRDNYESTIRSIELKS